MTPDTRLGTPGQIAWDNEMARRRELRDNYLVPVYVMWTSDVPEEEGRAGLEGVKDVLTASGQNRELSNLGSTRWWGTEYSSADWYIEEAVRRGALIRNPNHGGLQVVAQRLAQLFDSEPWQVIPHREVMIVNRDLTTGDSGENYVFGVTAWTNEFTPYSIQSVTRLEREITDKETRLRVIRRLLRHEVGHMFGLPSFGRKNTEMKLGRHCTNVCTMRQGMSSDEWITQLRQEERAGVQFCGDCMSDLARSRDRFKPLPPTS